MGRRKKITTECENQISIFDANKGELLEYQMKRLFFFMGYYVKTNINIQTSSDEPYDVVTDLDVYGNYIHKDFLKKTIWADCKSGDAQEINRIAWLNGIKSIIKVDDILFIKKGTKISTKLFANSHHIQIVDLNMVSDMERKYGIDNGDWRNLWNPISQKQYIDTFKHIKTPNNEIYKRILKFINTHYWAIEDNFTRCKKTITALKDLSGFVGLPFASKEIEAIRWAIFELIGLLMFAMLQICRQIHYLPNRDKKELIINGLIYGSNSKAKIQDILKVTNNIAKKTMENYCGHEIGSMCMPEIRLNSPEYSEAFVDMILRITEKPMHYFDILRFLDFSLSQYDLQHKEYDLKELASIFCNHKELLKSMKVYLHFISYITRIPLSEFSIMENTDCVKKG